MFQRNITLQKDGITVEVPNYSKLSLKIQDYMLEFLLYVLIASPILFILAYYAYFPGNTLLLMTGSAVLTIGSALTIWGGFFIPKKLKLTKYTLESKKIKNPLKIVFLADIGAGNAFYSKRNGNMEKLVEMVNERKPDLILIGGDFINFWEEDIPQLKPLKYLKSKYGVYGVLGNHDYVHVNLKIYKADIPWKLIKQLKKLGIEILGNDGKMLNLNGNKLYLGGIWDIETLKFDHNEALRERKGKPYTILMSHNPDIVDWIRTKDKIDLVVSGHLHGGQIKLPIIGPVILPVSRVGRKLLYGLYKLNKCKLLLTSGAGQSGTRARLGTTPEIVEIELRSK